MDEQDYALLRLQVYGGFALSALLIILGAYLAVQGADALVQFGLRATGASVDLTTRSVGALFAVLGALLAAYTVRTPLPRYRWEREARTTRKGFDHLRQVTTSPQELEDIAAEETDFERKLQQMDRDVEDRVLTQYHKKKRQELSERIRKHIEE